MNTLVVNLFVAELTAPDNKQIILSDGNIVGGRFGASSVDLTVGARVDARDCRPLKLDPAKRFKQTFGAEGVGMPFPRMDVHLHQPA